MYEMNDLLHNNFNVLSNHNIEYLVSRCYFDTNSGLKNISLESQSLVNFVSFVIILELNSSMKFICPVNFYFLFFTITLMGLFKNIRKYNFLPLATYLEITSIKTEFFTRPVSVWVSIEGFFYEGKSTVKNQKSWRIVVYFVGIVFLFLLCWSPI